MPINKWILLLSLQLAVLGASAQDWQSLHLKMRFDTIAETIEGETWQKVQELGACDTLVLNAVRIEVKDLRLDGKEAAFNQNDTAIFIALNRAYDSLELYIRYKAKPRKGLYFIGWQDESRRSRRQIWTQGQGIDHRHWIPHNDNQGDKILFSAVWIFDSSYTAMSNGKLDSTTVRGSEKHWYYSMDKPMSSYLIALTLDRYEVEEQRIAGKQHFLYHYPERREDASWYYYRHADIAAFLQAEIAHPYPWQNYKQAPVQDFRHGAMENTAATIFGDFFLVDSLAFRDQNYTYVDAHEYAHQWFGNLVTAAGSKHHWLHEGFATYYQWLSEQQIYGADHFAWELEKAREMVELASAQNPLPLAHAQAGSARFYQKGAWLLYMLRNYAGDSIYRAVIAQYLQRYAYKVVRNEDLIALFETKSKADIQGFFDTWLYADREPSLQIQREAESDLVELELMGELVQPLILVEEYNGNRIQRKLQLKEGRHKIKLQSAEAHFFFANYRELLITVEEKKVADDWYFQYEHAESFSARYFALSNLVGQSPPRILAWSRSIAENDSLHYGLRTKAFEIYASQALPDWRKETLLNELLARPDLKLQKRLLEIALEQKLKPAASILAKLRSGGTYQLRKYAMQLSLDPRNVEANRWLYDSIYRVEPGIPGKFLYLESLFYRLYLFQDTAAYRLLLDYASISFDFNTRINALQFLAFVQDPDSDYLEQLWPAFFNSNWKLVRVAREGLQTVKERQPQLWEEYYYSKRDSWTDFQKRKAARTFEE